ncbi:G0/G1 switch protein 2 [Vanacampus margaritifer]
MQNTLPFHPKSPTRAAHEYEFGGPSGSRPLLPSHIKRTICLRVRLLMPDRAQPETTQAQEGPFAEMIPFVKEMLKQSPGRSVLKIYVLGSALVALGVLGGLLEMAFLPFPVPEQRHAGEDAAAEVLAKAKKRVGGRSHAALLCSPNICQWSL